MLDNGTIILVAEALAIVAGSWLVRGFLARAITRAAKRAGATPGLLRGVRGGLSVAWIVLVAAWLLSITGIASLFSILTLSGIVGLAVSLALQNTLSNMISGILLFSDGFLRLDDMVEYGGSKAELSRSDFAIPGLDGTMALSQ